MFGRIKALKRLLETKEDTITLLRAENKILKEKLQAEQRTFAVDVSTWGLYIAERKHMENEMREHAISHLAYCIGKSGFFKTTEHNGFIHYEVTLLRPEKEEQK